MKALFFITILMTLSFAVQAKKMKNFNKAMQQEINGFIKNNPEKYETKSPGRMPASASPVEVVEEEKNEETFEKMNNFDQQGIGLPKW
jgi:hypothetical protein